MHDDRAHERERWGRGGGGGAGGGLGADREAGRAGSDGPWPLFTRILLSSSVACLLLCIESVPSLLSYSITFFFGALELLLSAWHLLLAVCLLTCSVVF